MKKTALLLLAIVFGLTTAQATKHIITQSGLTFSPNLITVNVGDTIRWEWTGGIHTTTTKNIPAGAPTWDSPLTAADPSFEYVVTLPGEYEYKCTIHESMGMTGIFQTSSTGTKEYAIDLPQSLLCGNDGNCLRLFSNSEFAYKGEISIYDISGKKLYETQASFAAGNSEMLITDANISRGLYIMQLLTDQRKKISVKFYVQ
jgi:plastocyanin